MSSPSSHPARADVQPPTSRNIAKTRINRILPTALLAAAIAASPTAGHAQGQAQPAPQGSAKSDDDHSAHHPSDTTATPASPAPNTPAAGAQGQPSGMGMGIVGGGGAGGMMGGDMGAMMRNMMPMMRGMMAQRMDRMDGPMGMMSPRRVEGRIAFLRTELKITDAQQPAWNAFADALRAEARSVQDMRQRMTGQGRGMPMAAMPPAAGPQGRPMAPGPMQGGAAPGGMGGPMAGGMAGIDGSDIPFPEQADRLVQSLTARLESARAFASAGRALYAVLTGEQKRTADELLAMPMRGM